jgi:hypothetical protein
MSAGAPGPSSPCLFRPLDRPLEALRLGGHDCDAPCYLVDQRLQTPCRCLQAASERTGRTLELERRDNGNTTHHDHERDRENHHGCHAEDTTEASPSDPARCGHAEQSAGHEGMLTQALLIGYTGVVGQIVLGDPVLTLPRPQSMTAIPLALAKARVRRANRSAIRAPCSSG